MSSAVATKVARHKQLLRVEGMWCASCARAVERALVGVDGVERARVSAMTGTAIVEGSQEHPTLDLIQRVKRAGYRARPWVALEGVEPPAFDPRRDLTVRFLVALVLGMWVMTLQLADYVTGFGGDARLLASVSAVLSTPVVWLCGLNFHRAAWRTLKVGAPGMDFLVSAGSIIAWSLSLAELLRGSAEVWFDSATMLIVFLLGGRLLEASVRHRGLQTVRALLETAPLEARRFAARGAEIVSAASVAIGDRIEIREGERVPVDGLVVEGAAAVDRAFLTGEPVPEEVWPGERIFAGSVVSRGRLVASAEADVGSRRIDTIAARVRDALDQRPEDQHAAERFAERFVPVIGALAVLSGIVAFVSGASAPDAILRAVAVLVVTCPCALSLAAPLALAFSVSGAARRGIVFRDPNAFERASKVDRVVFDKTGTLTEGRPRLTLHVDDGCDEDQVLRLAASAEFGVAHPVARALREAAHHRGLSLDEGGTREVLAGRGVVWQRPDGARVTVGRFDGKNPSIAIGGQSVGRFEYQDPLRNDATQLIEALRGAGVEVSLWSGDQSPSVSALAQATGIEDARAELTPEEKASAVATLRDAGETVAFVGDGINDAPALARADLGIAVQSATESALAVAPVVLLREGLSAILDVLTVAKRTRSVLRGNITHAVLYNLLAVPLAASGVIGPMIAPIAMLSSSLAVTLNSSRLLGPGGHAKVTRSSSSTEEPNSITRSRQVSSSG